MKKKQSTKGSIAAAGQQGSRKRKTGNRIGNSQINSQSNRHSNRAGNVEAPGNILDQKAVRAKAVSKTSKKIMNVNLPEEISKLHKDLKAICIRIEKAEKEHQEIFYNILNEVLPQENRVIQRWVNLS